MTQKKRALITVSSEMEQQLDVLKKEEFYNTSYSEMYRVLLARGLQATQNKPAQKE